MRTKDEQFARPLKSFLTYVQKASGPEVVVFGDEYGGPDGEHFRIGVVDGGARVDAQPLPPPPVLELTGRGLVGCALGAPVGTDRQTTSGAQEMSFSLTRPSFLPNISWKRNPEEPLGAALPGR